MRIAFFGTPEPALPSLRCLDDAEDVEVLAVVTNPDRPRGRSRTPRPPPVKQEALARGLPLWQPERPAEIADDLAGLDLDCGAVVAYGALLPPAVLQAAGRGLVNLHLSLLPRWRGAAPVHHALRAGDTVTGLTTFVLDAGMDTGPVLRQEKVAIRPGETAGELTRRLADRGAGLLLESLRALVAGEAPTPQPEEGATLASKVSPEDVGIDWSRPATEVVNLVRAANPDPGAHTTFRGDRLKVWRAAPADPPGDMSGAPPGQVVALADGPVVAAGDGAVRLAEVQPAGKGRMDGASFVNGYQPAVGDRLGS